MRSSIVVALALAATACLVAAHESSMTMSVTVGDGDVSFEFWTNETYLFVEASSTVGDYIAFCLKDLGDTEMVPSYGAVVAWAEPTPTIVEVDLNSQSTTSVNSDLAPSQSAVLISATSVGGKVTVTWARPLEPGGSVLDFDHGGNNGFIWASGSVVGNVFGDHGSNYGYAEVDFGMSSMASGAAVPSVFVGLVAAVLAFLF